MTIECVAETGCDLGEGPIWHPGEQRLFWVDITAGKLHTFDPRRDEHECVFDADVIGGFTIQRDGSLLLFMDGGQVGHYRDGSLETVERIVDSSTRFNDVIADPAGRVFCGTMPTSDRGGSLYRLDPDGSTREIESDVAVPNGMDFSPDRQNFYFTESNAQTIYRYAYDESTGEVSDRDRFVHTPDGPGIPDGMTVDASGCLWSARWEGGCVVRYDATGTELDRFEVPATKPTSVCFGGDGLEDLYVSSATAETDQESTQKGGALFRLARAGQGVVEFRSDISL